MAKHTSNPWGSNREQEQAATLKEALARTDILELMQVYQITRRRISGSILTVWQRNARNFSYQLNALSKREFHDHANPISP